MLKLPLITEKTTRLAQTANQYTFIVEGKSTKAAVSQLVEQQFSVTVLKVNFVNLPAKARHVGKFRRRLAYTPAKKKAILTLKTGDSIVYFLPQEEDKKTKKVTTSSKDKK